jgi:hypothetical protein
MAAADGVMSELLSRLRISRVLRQVMAPRMRSRSTGAVRLRCVGADWA